MPCSWVTLGKITLEGYILNNFADAAAEVTAEKFQPRQEEMKEQRKWTWVAYATALDSGHQGMALEQGSGESGNT